MPTATQQQTTFQVPTIDVAPYLADPASPAASQIIKDVRAACISTGFFQIVGHGIPKHLQQGIFDAAHNYFALPLDEKKKLDSSKTVGHRGYDVLASQSYEEGVEPDLKEGYYVGADVSPSDPLHGRFLLGPNVWPQTDILPTAAFQTPCERYYKAVSSLALKILEIVGATLAPDTSANGNGVATSNGVVNSTITVPPVVHDLAHANTVSACPLRLLHYPSASHSGSNNTDKPQYGASAHTDFGAITLLLQDDNPGLEVLDTTTKGENVWRPIEPNPDAYVVNIGDMLSMVTGNAYKSSVHRVVCKRPERERYSIVYFFDGCPDAVLRPVEGVSFVEGMAMDAAAAEGFKTVEQHMVERMAMSYGTGTKDARRDLKTESA